MQSLCSVQLSAFSAPLFSQQGIKAMVWLLEHFLGPQLAGCPCIGFGWEKHFKFCKGIDIPVWWLVAQLCVMMVSVAAGQGCDLYNSTRIFLS
jgi:hypothetical protein